MYYSHKYFKLTLVLKLVFTPEDSHVKYCFGVGQKHLQYSHGELKQKLVAHKQIKKHF